MGLVASSNEDSLLTEDNPVLGTKEFNVLLDLSAKLTPRFAVLEDTFPPILLGHRC